MFKVYRGLGFREGLSGLRVGFRAFVELSRRVCLGDSGFQGPPVAALAQKSVGLISTP